MQFYEASSATLAVIAAPLLWPIAAILQLLFPVILRDRVRAYRWACAALIIESGLLILQWLLDRFWPGHVPAGGLTWSLVAVTASATVAAWWQRSEVGVANLPLRVEWWAFAVLLAVFCGRAVLAAGRGTFEFDLGVALAIGAAAAILHLFVRQFCGAARHLTTQRVFLTAWCLAGVAVADNVRTQSAPPDATAVTGDWPTFRANMQRTGSLDPADAGPKNPRVLWRYRFPGDCLLYASPVVVGGEVIVVVTQMDLTGNRLVNRLYGLAAETGKLKYSAELSRAGISSPAVRGPLVVVGEGYHEDRDCHLRIFDRRTKAVVGSFATASHVESSPVLEGNHVFLGAGEDGVFAIELAEDGTAKPLWHVCGNHVDAAPAVVENTVFVGSVPGDAGQAPALLAIASATGDVRWRRPAPLAAVAAPAVDSGRVFFALGNGKLNRDAAKPSGALWCLDAKTGDRLWEVGSPASFYASPVCFQGQVFVAAGDGLIQCLRQADGSQVWHTSVGGRVVAGPIVSGGAVYVLAESGRLFRLDAATGRFIWRFDDLEEAAPAGDVRASPALAGGRIFVAAGGYLFCIGERGE